MEHYVPNARHIEIQIIGDMHGNIVHCFERDCSLQRRYQKILEEAPSPALSAALRNEIASSALTIARHIGYRSAGTVEFIFDCDRKSFFFLEMNTRNTGRASGHRDHHRHRPGRGAAADRIGRAPRMKQEEIGFQGHAIECRINAESASSDFMPCPGTITVWNPPRGEGIRVDSHCYSGYRVSPYLRFPAGQAHHAGQHKG
jgi:acetyl-CoA carboxylase biotin carboxylase subunit